MMRREIMRKKVVWFWFGDIVCMMVRLDFFNKVLLKKMKHCIVLSCCDGGVRFKYHTTRNIFETFVYLNNTLLHPHTTRYLI